MRAAGRFTIGRRLWRRLPSATSVVLAAALLLLGSPGFIRPAAANDHQTPTLRRLDRLLARDPPAAFLRPANGRQLVEPSELDEVATGLRQTFVSRTGTPRAILALILWDPTEKPTGTEFALGIFDGVSRLSRNAKPFDAAGVDPNAIGWRVDEQIGGRRWQGNTAVVRHGGLIIQVWHWRPAGSSTGAVVSELRDLVTRQRARPTVPLPTAHVPREAAYLDALMLDTPASPGRPFVLIPGGSGVETTALWRRTGIDESRIREFDRYNDRSRGMVRLWAIPNEKTSLRIAVSDEADSLRAGKVLDGTASVGVFHDRSDTVTRELEADQNGNRAAIVAGRRGQYFILVTASGARPREELRHLAVSALDQQRGRLPAGDTARITADEDPGVAQLAGDFFGLLGTLALTRLAAGRWKRRRRRIGQQIVGAHPTIDSVRREARRLRRTGVAMGITLVALASFAPAYAMGLSPTALVAYALIPGIVLGMRQWERRGRAIRLRLRRPRLVRSALIAASSVVVLTGATLLAMTSARINAFGRNLAGSDFQRATGAELQPMFSTIALALPLLAALLFRVARRQARLRADELRRLDTRPQVLYLRAFADDRLKIPTIVSGRRPVVELLSPFPTESYEAIVAWSLDAAGPTVAVAPPGARLSSLGAARQHAASDEGWQAFVASEMAASGVIALSLGRSEGLLWELKELVEQGLLGRALILFPPVKDDELRARWAAAAPAIAPATLPLDPASVLVATFDDGCLRAFTADQRDEAGYRAAIGAALARIPARDATDSATRALMTR